MKRILASLVFVAAGSLISIITLCPATAWSDEPVEQYLIVDSPDDDLILNTLGCGGDGDEGDPDTAGDGFGFYDPDDSRDDDRLSSVLDPDFLEDLVAFLMVQVWLIP